MGFWAAATPLLAGAMNLFGIKSAGESNVKGQLAANRENIKAQKEFAQHGISWKVKDAIDAGLHPLAALGAQTTSFSPSSIAPDYSYMEKMGQSGRDIAKHFGPEARSLRKYTELKAAKELEHMDLVNAGLRKDLDGSSNDNVTDHMQDPSKVIVQPSQPTAMGNPGISAGIHPMLKYTMNPQGYIFPTPTQDIQELISEGMNPTQARYLKDWIMDRGRDMNHWENPFSQQGYDYRNFLITLRPKTYSDGTPLKPGDEFRYSTNKGFKLYQNIRKSQFYEKDIGIANNNPADSRLHRFPVYSEEQIREKKAKQEKVDKTFKNLLRRSRSKRFY